MKNLVEMRMLGVVVILLLLVTISATAQDLNKELGKPKVTIIDNLEIDPDVNTVEYGVNRNGQEYVFATYYDTGNTVRHLFRDSKCVSVEFRSTNFRDYNLLNDIVEETLNSDLYDKFREKGNALTFHTTVSNTIWTVKLAKK